MGPIEPAKAAKLPLPWLSFANGPRISTGSVRRLAPLSVLFTWVFDLPRFKCAPANEMIHYAPARRVVMSLSMRIPWPVLPVFLALFIITVTSAAEPRYRLRIGDRAPDIEIARLEGGQLRLSALQRRALAVSFYSPYCEPCQRELPALARAVARVTHDTGADVKLVVILSDDRPDARFAAGLGRSMIWLLDDNQKAKAAFDPRTLPCTFIFGDDDIVRHINRGFGPQYEARVDGWLRKLVTNKRRKLAVLDAT